MTQRFQPPRELSRCVSALHSLCLTPARAHSCSQTFPLRGSSALKCLHARAPGCTPKKKKKIGFNYRRREPIRSLNLTQLFINQNTRCLRQRRVGGQLRSQPWCPLCGDNRCVSSPCSSLLPQVPVLFANPARVTHGWLQQEHCSSSWRALRTMRDSSGEAAVSMQELQHGSA